MDVQSNHCHLKADTDWQMSMQQQLEVFPISLPPTTVPLKEMEFQFRGRNSKETFRALLRVLYLQNGQQAESWDEGNWAGPLSDIFHDERQPLMTQTDEDSQRLADGAAVTECRGGIRLPGNLWSFGRVDCEGSMTAGQHRATGQSRRWGMVAVEAGMNPQIQSACLELTLTLANVMYNETMQQQL